MWQPYDHGLMWKTNLEVMLRMDEMVRKARDGKIHLEMITFS